MKVILLLFLFLSICSGSGVRARTFTVKDFSCEVVKIVPHGTLCAIRPSFLDEGATDKNPKSFFGRSFGFGLHVLGIPSNLRDHQTLHLHFGGSFGKPYDEEKGTFRSATFINELMATGSLVVQLAYNNGSMVNGPRGCRKKYAEIDNCAGLVRHGKLFGGGPDFQKTKMADSILERLDKVREFLTKKKVLQGEIPWSQISVSGHSQGAGMALFMAMHFELKKVCLIAGGYDSSDSHSPHGKVADWLDPQKLKTPLKAINALIHVDDKFYDKLIVGYEALGLKKGKNWIEIKNKNLHNGEGELIKKGHGAVIGAIELGDIWRNLCL